MGVINTLRNRMGKVVVGVIGFAIISFVLADVLGPDSFIFGGGRDTTVGVIGGEKISQDEYQFAIQERENNFILNFGRQPNEREKFSVRQMAWDQLLVKHGFEKEYETLGLKVSAEEMTDIVMGKNMDPSVRQSFTNPNTGAFDRQQLLSFLANLEEQDPQMRAQWNSFRNELLASRKRLKYDGLFTNTNYVTKAEARRVYRSQTSVAEVEYLYVPFYAVPDSAVTVTDDDLKKYLNDHKDRFKNEESRSIIYVSFSTLPTPQDSAVVRDEIEQLKTEFAAAPNDSTFAYLNSEGQRPYGVFVKNDLPAEIKDLELEAGTIYGPFVSNNNYRIIKVSSINPEGKERLKARHILFSADKEDVVGRMTAREEARGVLKDIKEGANFSIMASRYGSDGTASRGGDLGYFGRGDMVTEFEEAAFNHGGTGLLGDVVETDFGFHIIEVTEPVDRLEYELALIDIEIIPSDATLNEALRNADLFQGSVSNEKTFRELAEKDQLPIYEAKNIKKNSRTVEGLGEAREVVRWLYRDGSIGSVSEVFILDEDYVVGLMTGRIDEGNASLDDVRAAVRKKVLDQKKGEKIVGQLSNSETPLEDLAALYPGIAEVYSSNDLTLYTNTLSGAGEDPVAIGKAFSLEQGQRTQPFVGSEGVLIIELSQFTEAPEIADYTPYKQQILQVIRNAVSQAIEEAIRKAADIKDERYKFY